MDEKTCYLENLLANHISIKGLTSRIYKEPSKLNNKKTKQNKKAIQGALTVTQWIRSLLSLGGGCTSSPAQHSGLKDPVSLQLRHRSHLWLGCSPWPRNFHMQWVWQKKKKKKRHSVRKWVKDLAFQQSECIDDK